MADCQHFLPDLQIDAGGLVDLEKSGSRPNSFLGCLQHVASKFADDELQLKSAGLA